MLKIAYFSSLGAALATPLYVFAGGFAHAAALGLATLAALLVAMSLARGP
jgi:hypothetical protein